MNKLKALFHKLASNIFYSVISGTFVGVVAFYLITVLSLITGTKISEDNVETLLFFNVCSIIICFFITLISKKQNEIRRDADIVGDHFSGFGRKNRIFNKSLEQLLDDKPNYALRGFKFIEENYPDKTTDYEKTILQFYIARSYDEMNFFPNALRYYEKAINAGFLHEIIMLMYARCLGNNGDFKQALTEYNKISNNPESIYGMYVNTDIGRMYLKNNDAENAVKWYEKAIEKHENYAVALGEAAVAYTMLHRFDKGEELYRAALLNNISDTKGYTAYYKKIQAAALSESHTKECSQNNKEPEESEKRSD